MSALTKVAIAAIAALLPTSAEAATESLHREHVFPARPGQKVVVDVSFHEVEITARPGDTVEAVVDIEISGSASRVERLLRDLEPVFEQDENRILIRSARSAGFSWGWGRVQGRVVIAMPPDLDLTVDSSSGETIMRGDFGRATVDVDASSGGTRLQGAADAVAIDVSSGSVRLELDRPAESVRVDTSSGSVELAGGARSVTISTSSGSIEADGLLGDAVLDASSGSITARWDAIASGAEVTADSSSGGVRLTFPAGTKLAGRVDTSSGDIRTDFPGDVFERGSRLELAGGPDAVRISVDTSSGGVQLLAR